MDKAPDAFRTISEVADDLDVPQHVLRFWETRFAQIRPMKRSGGRRYYRPDDIDLLRGIRRLLYGEGYTIRGVQRILKEHGVKAVQAFADGAPLPVASGAPRAAAKARPDPVNDEADEDGIEEAADEHADVDDDDDAHAHAADDAPGDAMPALPPRPSAPPREAAASSAAPLRNLDEAARARLRAALDDLLTCRATLDGVLKEHPGRPLPK